MKKFRFRFEKILQLRVDKENDVKNKLAKINQKILDQEHALAKVIGQAKAFDQAIEEQMQEGVPVGQMRSMSHNKEYLIKAIDSNKSLLDRLLSERKAIQKELIEANKERKVMEKLKEKELAAHRALEEYEEKQAIDQIVTYQSTQKRGGK